MKTFGRRTRRSKPAGVTDLSTYRDKPFYDSHSSSQDSPSPQKPATGRQTPQDPYNFDVADTVPPVLGHPVVSANTRRAPRDKAAAAAGQQLQHISLQQPDGGTGGAKQAPAAAASVHKRSLLGTRSSSATAAAAPPVPQALAGAGAAGAAGVQAQHSPQSPNTRSNPASNQQQLAHTVSPAPAAAPKRRRQAASAPPDLHPSQQPSTAEGTGTATAAAAGTAAAPRHGATSADGQPAAPAPPPAPVQPAPPAAPPAARGPFLQAGSQRVRASGGGGSGGAAAAGLTRVRQGGSSGARTSGGGGSSSSRQQTKAVPAATGAAPAPAAPGEGGTGGSSGPTEARPVQTIMEAQERGELVSLQDDAHYALGGLSPVSSLGAQREAALALAELMSSRKGRLALRADGLAQQALSAAAKVSAGNRDPVLAGCAALMLLSLSAEDAHPAYLASTAAACLMSQLLAATSGAQGGSTSSSSAGSAAGTAWCPTDPSGQRLMQLVAAHPLARTLPPSLPVCPQSLLLAALAAATATAEAPARQLACDRLKVNLGKYGVLGGVAAHMASLAGARAVGSSAAGRKQGSSRGKSSNRCSVVIGDPRQVLRAADALQLGLVVLENSTFTCPENSAALLALELPGVGPLPALLVALAQALKGPALGQAQQVDPYDPVDPDADTADDPGTAGGRAACALQAALSVLMNLSHGSEAGGDTVAGCGSLQLAAQLLGDLLGPAAQQGQQQLAAQVLCHMELLSVALGLLINLASCGDHHILQLLAPDLLQQLGTAASSNSSNLSLVRLLCAVMTATATSLEAATHQAMEDPNLPSSSKASTLAAAGRSHTAASATPAARGAMPRLSRRSGGGVDLTEAALSDVGASSAASIVEVYSGVLLGSLAAASPEAAAVAGPLLPGGDLRAVVDTVSRCLEFYVSTGAITDSSRQKLATLLSRLQQLAPCDMQQ